MKLLLKCASNLSSLEAQCISLLMYCVCWIYQNAQVTGSPECHLFLKIWLALLGGKGSQRNNIKQKALRGWHHCDPLCGVSSVCVCVCVCVCICICVYVWVCVCMCICICMCMCMYVCMYVYIYFCVCVYVYVYVCVCVCVWRAERERER